MKNRAQLSQRQSQKLAPQMQLAIRLLHCSGAELEREIDNALSLNPVLERVDDAAGQALDTLDAADAMQVGTGSDEAASAQADRPAWDFLPEPVSLQAHLNAQWRLCPAGRRDRGIGEALIDALDQDGYWTSSYDDIRAATRFPVAASDAEIDAVRHLLQRFDPVGTACRDLGECLNVQLDQLQAEPALLAAARRIADGFLPVLAHKGVEAVAKASGLPLAIAVQAAGLLKTLDPKPGAAFSASRTDYIAPDFAVEKRNGRWRITALPGGGQGLRINAQYRRMAREARGGDALHLQQYLQEAQWLLAAIASRQDTLVKVIQAVIGRQPGFFERGPDALQAMTLRAIADDVGMHESTVSRACNGKYLATAHGLFELGRLFGSGVSDTGGQVQAASAIQRRIAELIRAEPPQRPLSDARLEALLAAQGLPVARRTVAKYREALRIPAASGRRRPA